MMNATSHPTFKVGDIVSLRPEIDASAARQCPEGRTNAKTAKIGGLLKEGGIHLESDLRGARWWNVEDLILA